MPKFIKNCQLVGWTVLGAAAVPAEQEHVLGQKYENESREGLLHAEEIAEKVTETVIPLTELAEFGYAIETGSGNLSTESGNFSDNLLDNLALQPIVLVLGSEGKGLRPVVAEACDALITIESEYSNYSNYSNNYSGNVDSMNVSAAGAVLLHSIGTAQRLATAGAGAANGTVLET